MLAKIFASSLVVLILLPFTAPFSTYELGNGRGASGDHSRPFAPEAAAATAADNGAVLVPARVVTTRAKLSAIHGNRTPQIGSAAGASLTAIAASSAPPPKPAALLTTLRL